MVTDKTMIEKPAKDDRRTPEQIREHYSIAKELAGRLRNASKQERRFLYASLYDELYRRVPFHPLLARKASPAETDNVVRSQMRFLRPFLNENTIFLEVGAGDCALAVALAGMVKQVYAVDVSDEITRDLVHPPNFQLILSDGSSIPVPPGKVDVVYSNQLMEHLHPDDAFEQLVNIYRALVPGGMYICITPNRLSGPHDVSRYFDEVATCFHLKEYTTNELSSLFRRAGFSRAKVYMGGKGRYIGLPASLFFLHEALLAKLPFRLRKVIARSLPVRFMLGIRLVGIK